MEMMALLERKALPETMELLVLKALPETMVPLVLKALPEPMVPLVPLGRRVLILKCQAHKALMAMTEPPGHKALPEMMVLPVRRAHKVNAVVMELLVGKAHQGRKALKAPQDPALSLVSYKVD